MVGLAQNKREIDHDGISDSHDKYYRLISFGMHDLKGGGDSELDARRRGVLMDAETRSDPRKEKKKRKTSTQSRSLGLWWNRYHPVNGFFLDPSMVLSSDTSPTAVSLDVRVHRGTIHQSTDFLSD